MGTQIIYFHFVIKDRKPYQQSTTFFKGKLHAWKREFAEIVYFAHKLKATLLTENRNLFLLDISLFLTGLSQCISVYQNEVQFLGIGQVRISTVSVGVLRKISKNLFIARQNGKALSLNFKINFLAWILVYLLYCYNVFYFCCIFFHRRYISISCH